MKYEECRSKTGTEDRRDGRRNRWVPALRQRNTHATSRGALRIRYAVESGRFLSIVTYNEVRCGLLRERQKLSYNQR